MEFLIGCGSSVVGAETGNSLLPKIKKHIGYFFNYNLSVESLKAAHINLDVKIHDANRFVHDTDMRLKDVSSTVTQWRSASEKLHQKAQTIITDNNRRSPLNPWSRYSSSKNALELAQEINQKVQTAPDFGTVFDRPTSESGFKFNLKGFMDFDSRLAVLNGVLEALKDEKVSMCSMCGMGGVGKTTLAKKLIQRVERDHLFDKVAMVTVSQNPHFEKVQNEIIELLELKISETTIPARANKLNDWLANSRTLLILDDVWWQLTDDDFEKVGIPLGCKGCKIVVTSRNEDECKRMGSQWNFLIDVLEDGEAWVLFTQKAGKCIDDLNMQKTAKSIANECGGLPIAIVTIATALKDKPIAVWDNSLRQLQKSNLLGISGMEKVYSRIKLSYDLLNDWEAQSCFRLCCLFPEDDSVPAEHLVLYGKGLQLFENVETMKEARDRVETIIDKLKKSFLLLDGEEDGSVKMHDIVRDFAISISSNDDEDTYLVGCEKVMKKWPATSHYENCSAISFICDKIEEHRIDLRCPKLQLLRLCSYDGTTGLPIGFFGGMEELKVLDLVVPPLLQPLTTLKKLRTLRLTETTTYSVWNREPLPKVGELLGHGNMEDLEILQFATKRPCDNFPEEIGLLCNLRLLKFDRFMKFKHIPPGVLSKLVKLEELELPWEFIRWGCKEEGGERVNASLKEIEALPLTALKISVTKGSILAENLVNNLTRFDIFMGRYSRHSAFHHYSNAALEVFIADACDVTMSWMRGLLRKCVSLTLIKVRNLKNIMCLLQSVEDNGFPLLKDIFVRGCNEMEYLVGTVPTAEQIPSTFFWQLKRLQLWALYSLKEIWHGPYFSKIETPCFSNLCHIEIYRCPQLKRMFPLPVARELRQLQFIHIWECYEMEEGFYRDGAEDVVQLTASATSTSTILNPSTSVNSNIDEKPQLICPTPNSIIRCLQGRAKHSKMVSSRRIMEENIVIVDEKDVDPAMTDAIIFPQLKTLKLVSLHKLRILYDGNHAIELPSLEELRINGCNEMEALSYASFNAPKLEEIEINCINYPALEDLNAVLKKMLNHEKLDSGKEDVTENDKDDEIHPISN